MPVATHLAAAEACIFCGGGALTLLQKQQYHNRNTAFGPFDIYCCRSCGSWSTEPVPTFEQLRNLYDSYVDGLPEDLVDARKTSSQRPWYRQCLRRAANFAHDIVQQPAFQWLEVAPGGGDFAEMFAKAYPRSKGTALDLHDRPKALTAVENLEWRQGDVNIAFPKDFTQKFDFVASISVFEHVQRPDEFLAHLLSCVRPGGVLYIVCPDAGSWMARALGRRWPYSIPGEHLFMSTIDGSRNLVQKKLNDLNLTAKEVRIRPVWVPYTLRYLACFTGAKGLTNLIPSTWAFPVPAGAQEIMIRTARA